MSEKIKTSINTAFRTLTKNGLTKSVIINPKTTGGYDFATRTTITAGEPITRNVVVEGISRAIGEPEKVNVVAVNDFKITTYTSFTIGEETYKVIDYKENDYIYEITLAKEG